MPVRDQESRVRDAATDSGAMISPERFDPKVMSGLLVEAEHLVRYLVAARFAVGGDIIDIGCGTGWGTALLAKASARRCVGIDQDESAIAQAREMYPEVAEFTVGDAQELALPSSAFDVVVCLETIEHVTDPDRVLDEVRRVLRPNGLLVISSPNPEVYPPGNPHHVREFRPQELQSALRRRFAQVILLSQQSFLASLVAPISSAAVGNRTEAEQSDLFKLAGVRSDQQRYTIAIACDTRVPDVRPAAVFGEALELRFWHKKLAACETALALAADLERQVSELSERLLLAEQASERIVRLESENERLKADLVEYHSIVHTRVWRMLWPWRRVTNLARRLLRRALPPPDSRGGA